MICLAWRGLLFAVLLFLLFVPAESPVTLAHINLCPMLDNHWTYSGPCRSRRSEVTRCGSFCFYAVCVQCTPWTHSHSCGDDCSYSHTGIRPPCRAWDWYLFYPAWGVSSRTSAYESHNLATALTFGMVSEGYVPPVLPCVKESGEEDVLPWPSKPPPVPTPLWVEGLNSSSGPRQGHGSGLVLDIRQVDLDGKLVDYPAEVSLRDLSHLPFTPPESGAPFFTPFSPAKVDDTSVTLQAYNWGTGTRQYRYWSYSGLREEVDGVAFANSAEAAPTEFRVPFEDLAANGVVSVVPGLRGIISFQVRSVDTGVSSGNSDIKHEMVGMEGFHSIGPPWPADRTRLEIIIPSPTPPVTATPLPTLRVGSRPARPAIVGVVQVGPGGVDVELGGFYPHDVEYRWWPHSGFGPTAAFEAWCPAGVRGGTFRVSDVEPKTPIVAGAPSGAVFDFQVRLVNSEGVSGDPSEAVMLVVWGGDHLNWSPRLVIGPAPPIPTIPVPVPFTTPRAPGVC